MRISSPGQALDKEVDSAVRLLRQGQVVAIPTDTLYGLAACAFDEAAVDRVFRLKGRPRGLALPLLLASANDVGRCAVDVPEVAWGLAERFWPGALTMVLKKADAVPAAVTGGKGTVALRVPDHQIPLAIVRELGAPVTGTSANRSGKLGLATAEEVRLEFGAQVALVVTSGGQPRGVASTVLDLSSERPRLLREGAVSRREIEAVCGLVAPNT